MSNNEFLGLWYCELVEREQSEEEAEEFGEYDDYGMREPQKAAKTEFAEAVLELRDDGSYELRTGLDYYDSHGRWTDDDGCSLAEADDASNGFERLDHAYQRGDRFVLGFKLVPDAHDGLDILVLSFGRSPPAAKQPKPEGFVEQLMAVEDEDELYDLLDEFDGDPAEVERALWDAWVDGRFLADPESFSLHLGILDDDKFSEAGGFTHAHAKHALTTIDYDEQRDLFDTVLNRLPLLPEDEAADAELAPLITGKWFDHFVRYRFLGGGLPEAMYQRKFVPQPQVDAASREYLLGTYYTIFDAIERLFPPGDADVAKVVVRYRGRGLLTRPLALIDARGLADEALAAAVDLVAQPETAKSFELWLNGILFVVVLSIRAGRPVPVLILEALPAARTGMVMGGLDDDEKATLRELITALPEDQRELVSARFWLKPKT